MQSAWERRHPLLALDDATLAHLLQPAFAGRRIVAAQPLPGGLVNTNYRVTLDGLDDPVVLRIYAREAAACRTELDIYHLVSATVPVPELLYADPDATRWERPYLVQRFVAGLSFPAFLATQTGDPEAVRQAGHSLGATAAAIAHYTFSESGFFGPGLAIVESWGVLSEAFRSGIREYLFERGVGERLGAALTAQLWTLVDENASLLTVLDAGAALQHGDYRDDNLLLRQRNGAWEVAAVLDWEFAFAWSPLFDLGQLFRRDLDLPPAFEPAVVEGYHAAGGALPPGWKRMAKLLDLVNLLDFLSQPRGGTMHAEVTSLVRQTVERWPDYT
jgi:aminoglycoside phosphotransferase (APT) family kinase protein